MDIYHTLHEYTSRITVFDPWADPLKVEEEYGIRIQGSDLERLHGRYDAVILGVAHSAFQGIEVRKFLRKPSEGVVYDVKGVLPREDVDARL